MRVDLTTTIAPEPPEPGKPGRAGQTDSAAIANNAGDTSGLDSASFSSTPAQVQSLTAQVLAQPDIRQAKLQALQEAIGNDTYSIPPSQIADALAREFGGAQG